MEDNESFDKDLSEFVDIKDLKTLDAEEEAIEEPPHIPEWAFTSYENELQIVTEEIIPDVEFLNINGMEFKRIRKS